MARTIDPLFVQILWYMFVITFYQVVLYIKMFYCNHYTGNFLLCMVRYCVAFQITDQNKTFAIILQIFFRVSSSRVDRQMAICNAWKVTMWTSVRLLPRVGHFLCQIELSTEFKDHAGCPLSLSQLNGRQTNDSMSENIQLNLFVNLCKSAQHCNAMHWCRLN